MRFGTIAPDTADSADAPRPSTNLEGGAPQYQLIGREDVGEEQPPGENYQCPNCCFTARTLSASLKHRARHEKKFVCNYPGCLRKQGFATANDLERHSKCVHAAVGVEDNVWKCFVHGCKASQKIWLRQDNFRAHIDRMHKDVDVDEYVQLSDNWLEYEEKPRRRAASLQVKSDNRFLAAGHESEPWNPWTTSDTLNLVPSSESISNTSSSPLPSLPTKAASNPIFRTLPGQYTTELFQSVSHLEDSGYASGFGLGADSLLLDSSRRGFLPPLPSAYRLDDGGAKAADVDSAGGSQGRAARSENDNTNSHLPIGAAYNARRKGDKRMVTDAERSDERRRTLRESYDQQYMKMGPTRPDSDPAVARSVLVAGSRATMAGQSGMKSTILMNKDFSQRLPSPSDRLSATNLAKPQRYHDEDDTPPVLNPRRTAVESLPTSTHKSMRSNSSNDDDFEDKVSPVHPSVSQSLLAKVDQEIVPNLLLHLRGCTGKENSRAGHGGRDDRNPKRGASSGGARVPSSNTLQNRHRSKRRRLNHGASNGGDGEDEDGPEEGPSSKRTSPIYPLKRQGDRLACQFHKKDPREYCLNSYGRVYKSCRKGFADIKALKDHIRETHQDKDILDRVVSLLNNASPDFLREVQMQRNISKALGKKKSPKTLDKDAWYEIWDTLFDPLERPESPYNEHESWQQGLNDILESALPSVQELALKEMRSFYSSRVPATYHSSIEDVLPMVLAALMDIAKQHIMDQLMDAKFDLLDQVAEPQQDSDIRSNGSGREAQAPSPLIASPEEDIEALHSSSEENTLDSTQTILASDVPGQFSPCFRRPPQSSLLSLPPQMTEGSIASSLGTYAQPSYTERRPEYMPCENPVSVYSSDWDAFIDVNENPLSYEWPSHNLPYPGPGAFGSEGDLSGLESLLPDTDPKGKQKARKS